MNPQGLFKSGILLFCALILLIGVFFLINSRSGDVDKASLSDSPILHKRQPDPSSASQCKRIVSLAPSVTEILYTLGLGDNVVGVTRYCNYPPEAKSKAQVGGYYDPNLEVVYALRPDQVIMLWEHQEKTRLLSRMGIRRLAVHNHTIQEILDSIQAIGSACNRQEEAQELVSSLEHSIRRIEAKVQGRPRPKVLISIGRDIGSGSLRDVYVAGRNNFFNEMLLLAGGQNAYEGLASIQYPVVSQEGILKLNPDIIIEMIPKDKEGNPAEKEALIKEWSSLSQVKAVKNRKIYLYNEEFMVRPSSRFTLALQELAAVIHPEVSWEEE